MVRFVSHEMRSPLNTVTIGLDLLKKDLRTSNSPKKTQMVETLADMKNQCDAAIEILNDLLNYEKLDSGIMTLDKAQVQAWSLLTESVQPFFIQVRLHRENIGYIFICDYCLCSGEEETDLPSIARRPARLVGKSRD